jgi:hypothetical protein
MKPPQAHAPATAEEQASDAQQRANTLSGTRDQTGPYDRQDELPGAELAHHSPYPPAGNPAGQKAGRRGLALESQRERERERRVSDADASYYASTVNTRTPKHVNPQRPHAKYNSLSETTRSLSQGPCFTG